MFGVRTLCFLGTVSLFFAGPSCARKTVVLHPRQSQAKSQEKLDETGKPPVDVKPSVIVEDPESADQKAAKQVTRAGSISFRFPSIIVRPGESISLKDLLTPSTPAASNLEFGIVPISELPHADLGAIDKTSLYKAPSSLTQEFRIKVYAMNKENPDLKAQMTLILVPLDKIFLKDDGLTAGIRGEIFLTPDLKMLPDFSKLVVHEKIVVPDLNFLIGYTPDLKALQLVKNVTDALQAEERFYKNNPKLEEGFSARFSGRIFIEKEGKYSFSLVSDDGARLYINDKLVTEDNRNKPISTSKLGEIALTRGECSFRVEYFNGFAKTFRQLGLVLHWKVPASDQEVVVPRDRFR